MEQARPIVIAGALAAAMLLAVVGVTLLRPGPVETAAPPSIGRGSTADEPTPYPHRAPEVRQVRPPVTRDPDRAHLGAARTPSVGASCTLELLVLGTHETPLADVTVDLEQESFEVDTPIRVADDAREDEAAGERPGVAASDDRRGTSTVRSGTTDDGGLVVFTLEATEYRLRVVAAGYPTLAGARRVSMAEGESLRLTLRLGPPGLRIEGRVLRGNGEPVENVTVEIRPIVTNAGLSDLVALRNWETPALSQTDGTFSFDDIITGDYELRASGPAGETALEVVAAGANDVELVLQQANSLSFIGVVRNRDGEPLSRATVTLVGNRNEAITDDNGRFKIDVPHPGNNREIELAVRARGYRGEQVVISAQPANALPLEVTLEAIENPTVLRGRIYDSNGDGVVGAVLQLRSDVQNIRLRSLSDGDGEFRFDGIASGDDYRLVARPGRGYGDVTLPLEIPAHGTHVSVLAERIPTSPLRGYCINTEAERIPHLALTCHSQASREGLLRFTTDSDGAFALDAVPAGKLTFSAVGAVRAAVFGVTTIPGSDRPVRLVLDFGTRVLRGKLQDTARRPVEGARLVLSWRHEAQSGVVSTSRRTTWSDAGGAFRFGKLSGSAHRLDVEARGFRNTHLEAVAAPVDREVLVTLTETPPPPSTETE